MSNIQMAESPECRTVVSCLKQLETALLRCDRDTTHFLHQEGFITTEVHDEVLSPGSNWTSHQKAGILVSGIMRKVALSAQNYNTLVDHFETSGKYYKSIVAILNQEYTRQIQTGYDMSVQQLPGSLPKLSDALSRYRKYLKSYYKNHSIALDDKLSIAPCSEFINLALIKEECYGKHRDFDSFSKSTFHGHIDEILAAKSPIKIDELLNSDFRVVLVEGPPGIGKSTLCWELCRKWDSYKSLQVFKIVLQLKLREERVQKAKELHELFYHKDMKLSQRVADEVLECEGEGVLLILDGFDEMPTSVLHKKNSLLIEIIDSRCLPKATCLVTSRPSALHHKGKFPRDLRHVEILGFTDDSKIKYVELAFINNFEVLTKFKNFIVSNPVVNSLLYIPINCAIFAQVYQDIGLRGNVTLPHTMTQLYSTLSLVLIRRHMIQIGEWDEDGEIPNKLDELPERMYTTFERVCELAYRGLFANEKEVQLVFSASDVGRDFDSLGLMSVSREMYVVSGAKVTYSFFHLSMQEFLAACHTTHHSELIAHVKTELNKTGFIMWMPPAHLNAYVRFLAGLVGLSKLFTKPIEHTVYFMLLHCYLESQNPTQDCKLFQSHHCVLLNSPLDAYVFGYVLTHATIDWYLHISIKDFDALLSSLRYHSHNHQISGSISKLKLTSEGASNFSFSLDDILSMQILQSVSLFELIIRDFISIEYVAAVIPAMCNLSEMEVSIFHCLKQDFQNDFMLFKALQTLKTLTKITFNIQGYTLSDKGVKNFINFFSKNSTLKIVELHFQNCGLGEYFILGNNYHSIIESVLSCPALASLITNIPFVTSKLPSNLKHLNFRFDTSGILSIWSNSTYTVATLRRCICCIADLCANSTLETLRLNSLDDFISIPQFRIFLPILKESLNQSNFKVKFVGLYPSNLLNNISVLLQSLNRDTHTQRSFIRSSNSLCDLSTNTRGHKRKMSVPHVSRSHSCPDLFHFQSIHTLHPQLCKAILKELILEELMHR